MYQFVCTVIESPSLDFHVTLAQSILHTCLQHPELQNELYCQLIKQTSRHPVQHKTTVQVSNLLIKRTSKFVLAMYRQRFYHHLYAIFGILMTPLHIFFPWSCLARNKIHDSDFQHGNHGRHLDSLVCSHYFFRMGHNNDMGHLAN